MRIYIYINRNITRLVYCQYGQYSLTFRALVLSDEGQRSKRQTLLSVYRQYTDLFVFRFVSLLCLYVGHYVYIYYISAYIFRLACETDSTSLLNATQAFAYTISRTISTYIDLGYYYNGHISTYIDLGYYYNGHISTYIDLVYYYKGSQIDPGLLWRSVRTRLDRSQFAFESVHIQI